MVVVVVVVVAAAEVVVVAAVVGSGFVGGKGTKGTVSFDSLTVTVFVHPTRVRRPTLWSLPLVDSHSS